MNVFISYAVKDRAVVTRLRADIEQLGHRVWFDREVTGGQQWWSAILRQIKTCSVFVFAVSADSLRSKACLAELDYAHALSRPIVPVVVGSSSTRETPTALRANPIVEYNGSTDAVLSLLTAFNGLPPAGKLPVPLPKEPAIPTSYLNAYLERVNATELDVRAQTELYGALRSRLHNTDEQAAVWDLLVKLRSRVDLAPGVAGDLEHLLTPGWRPDPKQRFERRFWDGQSWTTLVKQDGREFNERQAMPQRSGDSALTTGPNKVITAHRQVDVLPPRRQPLRSAPERRAKRKVLPLAIGGVAVAVAGIIALVMLLPGSNDSEDAERTARSFVDAVNLHDETALKNVICASDRNSSTYLLYNGLLQTTKVALESVTVTDSSQATFSVVATGSNLPGAKHYAIPLVRENGTWRACHFDTVTPR